MCAAWSPFHRCGAPLSGHLRPCRWVEAAPAPLPSSTHLCICPSFHLSVLHPPILLSIPPSVRSPSTSSLHSSTCPPYSRLLAPRAGQSGVGTAQTQLLGSGAAVWSGASGSLDSDQVQGRGPGRPCCLTLHTVPFAEQSDRHPGPGRLGHEEQAVSYGHRDQGVGHRLLRPPAPVHRGPPEVRLPRAGPAHTGGGPGLGSDGRGWPLSQSQQWPGGTGWAAWAPPQRFSSELSSEWEKNKTANENKCKN